MPAHRHVSTSGRCPTASTISAHRIAVDGNYGIIKIFFHPTVNINAAAGAGQRMSQTCSRDAAGITPPFILSFSLERVLSCSWRFASDKIPKTRSSIFALNFNPPGAARFQARLCRFRSAARWRQVQADLNQQRCTNMAFRQRRHQTPLSLQNLINAVRNAENRRLRRSASTSTTPEIVSSFNDLPVKTVNGNRLYMRLLLLCAGRQVRRRPMPSCQRRQRRAADHHEVGCPLRRLDIINGSSVLRLRYPDLTEHPEAAAVGDQSVFGTDAVSMWSWKADRRRR